VIALTLDEKGIPDTAEGRVAIAERILAEAAKYGIPKKEIIVDPLAMTVSADPNAANITLRAIELLTAKGIKTSLGVSNVSFGLPSRETVNATFFALALQKGLSAAILNPNSVEMLKTYYAYLALTAQDDSCQEYIRFATEELTKYATVSTAAATISSARKTGENSPLKRAIIKGLKEESGRACEELLATLAPLEIVNGEIVPALDEVGKGYEEKRVFLPQLLMSAEAAKQAFEKIK
jgi:5-methyltetrahydrofolate--homocysteine methyltransferase